MRIDNRIKMSLILLEMSDNKEAAVRLGMKDVSRGYLSHQKGSVKNRNVKRHSGKET